jgi:PAS domain-containing protein
MSTPDDVIGQLDLQELLLTPLALVGEASAALTEEGLALPGLPPDVRHQALLRFIERHQDARTLYHRRRAANGLVLAVPVFGPWELSELPSAWQQVVREATLPWCITEARGTEARVLDANRAFGTLVGAPRLGRLFASTWWDWLAPQWASHERLTAEAMRLGSSALYFLRGLRRDGGGQVETVHAATAMMDGPLRRFVFTAVVPLGALPARVRTCLRARNGYPLAGRDYPSFQQGGEAQRAKLSEALHELLDDGPGAREVWHALKLVELDPSIIGVS